MTAYTQVSESPLLVEVHADVNTYMNDFKISLECETYATFQTMKVVMTTARATKMVPTIVPTTIGVTSLEAAHGVCEIEKQILAVNHHLV